MGSNSLRAWEIETHVSVERQPPAPRERKIISIYLVFQRFFQFTDCILINFQFTLYFLVYFQFTDHILGVFQFTRLFFNLSIVLIFYYKFTQRVFRCIIISIAVWEIETHVSVQRRHRTHAR